MAEMWSTVIKDSLLNTVHSSRALLESKRHLLPYGNSLRGSNHNYAMHTRYL